MNISVIVCCYNSENRILPTLEHLSQQTFENLLCEIILVDNNCTDTTIDVAKHAWESFGNPFQLNIIKEAEPGLSFARRCGVFAAQGEIIVFCDDDNWLQYDFLASGYSIMMSNQTIGVLGGLGIPVFQDEAPNWFSTYQGSYAVGCQALSSGDISSRGYVWGAGCFLRKSTMVRLYLAGFENICTDRKGTNLSSGGDSEICKWHLLIGKKLWYNEKLIFKHYIEDKRLKKEYYLNLVKGFNLSHEVISFYDEIIAFNLNESNRRKITHQLKLIVKYILFPKNRGHYIDQYQLLMPKIKLKKSRFEYFQIITALENYKISKSNFDIKV